MGATCATPAYEDGSSANMVSRGESKQEETLTLFNNVIKLQQLSEIPDAVEYGFLQDLVGTWVNSNDKPLGLNVICVPGPGSSPTGPGSFIPILFRYTESLSFSLNGGARNRGGLNEQFTGVSEYNQTVTDASGKVQHIENGMFMFLDNISVNKDDDTSDEKDKDLDDPYKPKFKYCRSGTVPHGNSIMLFGNELPQVPGPPSFDKESLDPIDPTMTMAQTGKLGYTDALENGLRALKTSPMQALQDAIKHQNIIKTRTISLSSKNKGRIGDTPFITKFANATEMDFVLWLETVKEADGKEFMQIQYQERIILEFDKTKDGKNIRWPHITVNTMRLKRL